MKGISVIHSDSAMATGLKNCFLIVDLVEGHHDEMWGE